MITVSRRMELRTKEEKQLDKLKESSESNPATQKQASGWNKPVRGLSHKRQKSWKVFRAVLIFPLLGKSLTRDFSPARPVLVEGKWERVVMRQAPAPGAGAMAGENTASWGFPCLKRRNTNTPAQAAQCKNVQFG